MLGTKLLEKFGWQPGKSDELSQDLLDQNVRSRYQKGLNLAEQGLHPQARYEFEQALAMNHSFAEAHYELGKTYKTLGLVDKAIKAFQTALRLSPDHLQTYNELGVIYDTKGNFLEAVKMYMKALRLKPNATEILNNLGVAYFNIGSYTEAIKAFKRVVQIEPNDAQAHFGLALVYIDLENKESALSEHETLKNLGHVAVADQLLDKIHRQFQWVFIDHFPISFLRLGVSSAWPDLFVQTGPWLESIGPEY